MLRLVLKDFLLQKKMLLFMFVYIVFFMTAFQGSGNYQVTPIIVAVSYMFLMTGCAWEDKNNSDVLLNSIPISRWRIVAAKYVSLIAYTAAAVLAYWFVKTVISVTGLPLEVAPIAWEGVLGGLLGVGLVSALYLPLFFRLGYLRSKSVNFIIFFGFFGLIGLLPKLFPKRPEWITALESAEFGAPTITVLVGIFVLLQGLSYAFSVTFYTRREF
jgi:ABC-2 type transport system permease protein